MHMVTIDNCIYPASDGERLSDVLQRAGVAAEHPCGGRGVCKKCTVLVDGKEVLSCQYRIFSSISVTLSNRSPIFSQTGATETGRLTEHMCFVLDIGTTTLALALVSLDDGSIIRVITRTNPQRIFGADIIARIGFCREQGVFPLQKAVTDAVNSMIDSFGLPILEKLYVTGNTTMLHLFFGVDCSAMGSAPYTPVFLDARSAEAASLGILGVKAVESLPSIAAFVGADLVAGMNFTGMPAPGKYHLLVDLGTNAEIVLYSRENILCTAAAAGPCFEGANISCGMSATEGAVYAVSQDQVQTIGNIPPKGICGTGLIDIISHLLENGILDETGYLECSQYRIAEGIFLTQADVRQFQTAKSAVCSAIECLMQMQNITSDDLDTVYISGGFSAKIRMESAVKTGLFPASLSSKCKSIHNSSLLGTIRHAIQNNNLSVFSVIARYIDLSSNPLFSELFIDNMMFPV